MANHAEAARHVLELLGHVLAQVFQVAAAVRAGFASWQLHPFLARQVRLQRLACSLLARRHIFRRLRLGHRLFRFEVVELELQLLDLLVELFRFSAKLHAPQLGQHQFQVLDLGGARRQLGG